MKNILCLVLTILALATAMAGKDKPTEKFSNAEENFKITMQKILEKYVDKSISSEDLYRAATQGMLESLNKGEEAWNTLLSPSEMKALEIDMSGKVTGIGVEMKFLPESGNAQILRVIPGTVSERAGLQADDLVLSVDGRKFKGKQFQDMVMSVRGEVGKSVTLKVLRGDQILSFNIKRETVPWSPVTFETIDNNIGLLTLRFFNEETPKMVEQKIKELQNKKIKKLIVDVRNNGGGGFDQAVQVSEIFVPKEQVVAQTKNRDGKIEKFKSKNGAVPADVQIILLTNKETFSGAELFTAALKENRSVKIVGESTFGKWTAQTLEKLPNKYAIKYTTTEFLSPGGQSFQDVGIKPDMEVSLPQEHDANSLRSRYELKKRADHDFQLKAALELMRVTN